MPTPVYKFWRSTFTRAWYALSEEEQNEHSAQMQAALKQVGGKGILMCTPAWSAEQWMLCGVEQFPDVEAVYKHTQLIYELDHFRYVRGESWLASEWPPV
jgi:hypothetical protein